MPGGPVHLRPQRLVYVRATGPYEFAIPNAWSTLLGWIEKNGFSSLVSSWYGLARDNPYVTPLDQCRYDACVPVDPMFDDRALRELGLSALPCGPYERNRHSTGYKDAITRLGKFYLAYAPLSGMQADFRRPIVTIYHDDPRKALPTTLRADICVPLKTASATGRNQEAA